MDDHLGYPKHAPEGRDRGNSGSGTRSKILWLLGQAHRPLNASRRNVPRVVTGGDSERSVRFSTGIASSAVRVCGAG